MSPRAAGLWAVLVAAIADQAHKYWMLYIFDIRSRQPVPIGEVLDLVLVWNPGISYSLLRMDTAAGRWMLVAFVLVAIGFLTWLLWRADNLWLGLGFGLIIGGAIGNLIDRVVYGAVADFFHFFVETSRWGRISWYVFNIADVAIVAGVLLLLYESLFVKAGGAGENGDPATKSPESGGNT